MKKLLFSFILLPFLSVAQIEVSTNAENSSQHFSLTEVSVLYDSSDPALIPIASNLFAEDIERVTGKKSEVLSSSDQAKGKVIIIGTLEGQLIQQLISDQKLDGAEIKGEWERFIIETVANPLPGIDEALVIVGSDKRGTAYGVFTLSEKIGVSPWYYWADAPVKKSEQLYIKKGRFVSKGPSVKYRGIFLNDEAPALRNWAKDTYGDFNSEFYKTVYELILRNKGNYLWPAMWRPSVFATDDLKNADVANDYGIVISTTHHEPMMRYHEEWGRSKGGAWNYNTNKEKLHEFWKEGIERMGDNESVVTLGMRGDGDEAMSEDTAVELMKNVIDDQREIIKEVTGKPIEETPQVWALYKEVQDYYDKGMRVDDDILILFCDDNWGNVRILPKKEDLKHPGGYGMYYHFDFVGGPVSYRWINVTQIERVWEQMNLTYQWGVKDLWLVNVGDLKPMELPISFFLDYAWDTSIKASDLPNYYVNWSEQQFGTENAQEIAEILALSTKYSTRRTPEMLKPDTYSLENYREADRTLEEYQKLLARSQKVYDGLPETHKAAFYQLVHFPIAISANLNEMYVAAGKNKLYGSQSRASTNYYADLVKEKFFKDAELIKYYHEEMADGKWNHMMSQTHIGYTSWNNPPVNKMPEVSYIQVPSNAQMDYQIEYVKSPNRWRKADQFLPFDPVNDQNYSVEIINKGEGKFDYTINAQQDWINVSKKFGNIQYEEKIYVSVDWDKIPQGTEAGEIILSGTGRDFTIKVPIRKDLPKTSGFVENNGVVSIEAAKFTKKVNSKEITWTLVPNLGRTHSALTIEPANAAVQVPGKKTPRLEYEFTLLAEGDVKVESYLSPTLNYKKKEGLKFAIAIDDQAPQIINIHEGEDVPDWEYPDWWNDSVTDHIKKKLSEHGKLAAGKHTLKIWMVDPGIVFQKFVIDTGGLKPSYLGPPESVLK